MSTLGAHCQLSNFEGLMLHFAYIPENSIQLKLFCEGRLPL